ncbi:DCC1-like thiol-disulfide oxidoreductase family protein [Nocardioides sp.]|uniref:thiol-disulfide oxidoreductase DCC family protein n=1 Tax=Nocardioides sp. TaxID=35761 RepID=UPI00286E4B02|nr:DCC1-like thiol-disulfide oxidoreductase family protein [Nocardioides sp.]
MTDSERIVIWDSYCSFCHRWAKVLAWLDVTGTHRFVGTAEPGAHDDPRVTREDTDRALQLLTPQGRFEGYDAIRRVLARSPITFWFVPLLWLPPVRVVGERLYWRIAASRTCAVAAPQPPLKMPWRRRRNS